MQILDDLITSLDGDVPTREVRIGPVLDRGLESCVRSCLHRCAAKA